MRDAKRPLGGIIGAAVAGLSTPLFSMFIDGRIPINLVMPRLHHHYPPPPADKIKVNKVVWPKLNSFFLPPCARPVMLFNHTPLQHPYGAVFICVCVFAV